jgi:hypothetical protein
VPWGGVPGGYLVGYLGFSRPRYRNVYLPAGAFRVDVIDTWEMTVEPLPGTHEAHVEVPLPGKPYMAIRLVRVDDGLEGLEEAHGVVTPGSGPGRPGR